METKEDRESKHDENIGAMGIGIVVGCFFAVLTIIVYILVW